MHSKNPIVTSANISISAVLSLSTFLCVDQKSESFCQKPYWGSLGSYLIFNKICYEKHFCIPYFCSSYFCSIGHLHGNKFFSLEAYSLPGAITFPLKNGNDVTEANQKRLFCLKTGDYRVVLKVRNRRYLNHFFQNEASHVLIFFKIRLIGTLKFFPLLCIHTLPTVFATAQPLYFLQIYEAGKPTNSLLPILLKVTPSEYDFNTFL